MILLSRLVAGALAGAVMLGALLVPGVPAARAELDAHDDIYRTVPGARLVISIRDLGEGLLDNDERGATHRIRLKSVFRAANERYDGIFRFHINRKNNPALWSRCTLARLACR